METRLLGSPRPEVKAALVLPTAPPARRAPRQAAASLGDWGWGPRSRGRPQRVAEKQKAQSAWCPVWPPGGVARVPAPVVAATAAASRVSLSRG